MTQPEADTAQPNSSGGIADPPAILTDLHEGSPRMWRPVLVTHPSNPWIRLALVASTEALLRRGDTVDLRDGIAWAIVKVFKGDEKKQVIGLISLLGFPEAQQLFSVDYQLT